MPSPGKDLIHLLQPIVFLASTHDVVHGHVGTGEKAQWAVRQGDWKLIGYPRDTSDKAPLTDADTLFLSNLARDPSEMQNFAKANPEVVRRLKALHDAWYAGF